VDGEEVFIGNQLQEATPTTRVAREFRDQSRDEDQISAYLDVVYERDFGPTQHTFLAGGEIIHTEGEDVFLTAVNRQRAVANIPGMGRVNLVDAFGYDPVPSLNLLDPDYGNSGPEVFDFADRRARESSLTEIALYAQNQIEFLEKFTLIVGGRWERFEEDFAEQRSSPFFADLGLPADLGARDQSQEDSAFTARTGLVYRATEALSAYGVFSQGFTPQPVSSTEAEGGPFDPERSRLIEGGVKWEPFSDRFLIQSAIYQITKQDLLVTNPDPDAPVGSVLPIGEVRSRGIEFDVVGDLTRNWAFNLSYAFNDVEVTDGNPAEISNNTGNEFVNAPDHQLGVWTRFDIDIINSAIAGGVSFVSEQISFSGQQVQPYAIVDLAWRTSWKEYQLQVNVRNLFDNDYAESGFLNRTGHFPGDPRTVRVEVATRF
jgi:iron complex outermembrane receptor protein